MLDTIIAVVAAITIVPGMLLTMVAVSMSICDMEQEANEWKHEKHESKKNP